MSQVLTLSVAEAAKEVGIGQDQVRELVKSGRIASIVPGKRNIRIPRIALDEYIRTEMTGGINDRK